jgi:hypothetical protein
MSRIKSLLQRADWLQHVSTWRTSGLTQAAYCREHQLNATTFNGWILREPGLLPATVPLTAIPVVIKPSTPVVSSAPSRMVLQHRSGWQLSLPADVQIAWLAQLLNELA